MTDTIPNSTEHDQVRNLLNVGGRKRLYIETYGCQMNVYDTELVARIMADLEYDIVDDYESADAIFLNTCAIRENAEQRVWGQLTRFKQLKEKRPDLVIGVLGCMAKHLEGEIHTKRPYVNLVLGPDSYRKLPGLLQPANAGSAIPVLNRRDDFSVRDFSDFPQLQMDTRLSKTEVYESVEPLRLSMVTAWIAIMRGCDNFCTFCVVPYTRGRERSRSLDSVVDEARKAVDMGFPEIGLLGQNVNSYRDGGNTFADLIRGVSDIPGVRRIRFTSPHPKDFPEPLLHAIAERSNICKQLHMPVQSGSNRVLELMNRTYTRDEYFSLIDRTRALIPDVAITTDVIAGFPTESEADHNDTLDLFRKVEFDSAFTFKYSPRPGTKAYSMTDDVPEEVKSRRLNDIIELQRSIGTEKIRREIGKVHEVLVEEVSRKSPDFLVGKTGKGQSVIIPAGTLKPRDLVRVRIDDAVGQTLQGVVVS